MTYMNWKTVSLSDIDHAEMALATTSLAAAGIAAAEAGPSPKPELNGQRVKVPGHVAVYLVDRGYRRHIPDAATYGNLFRTTADIREDTGVLDIPVGEPIVSGSVLVTADTGGPVYFLDQGRLRWIMSATVMTKYSFAWDKVRSIPQVVINGLQLGDAIDL